MPSARPQRARTVDGMSFVKDGGAWVTTFAGRRYQAFKNENDYYTCGSRWMLIDPAKKCSYHRSLKAIVKAIGKEPLHVPDALLRETKVDPAAMVASALDRALDRKDARGVNGCSCGKPDYPGWSHSWTGCYWRGVKRG